MKQRQRRPRWRLLAIAAVLVLALGAVGCGDSDGDGGSGGANAAQAGGGGDERQVRALFASFQKGIQAGDTTVCQRMTPGARKQLDRLVTPYENCPQGIRSLAARLKRADSATPARITRVAINGDQARLSVKAGDSPNQALEATKQGGEWMLSNLLVGAPPPAQK